MAFSVRFKHAVRLMVQYVTLRSKTYYYRRRIPGDLVDRYPKEKNGYLFNSLKTRDPKEAARRAITKTKQLDALWTYWRSDPQAASDDLISAAKAKLLELGLDIDRKTFVKGDRDWDNGVSDYLTAAFRGDDPLTDDELSVDELDPLDRTIIKLVSEDPSVNIPRFSQATQVYIKERGLVEGSRAHKDAMRSTARFIAHAGDLPLTSYRLVMINDYRDYLLSEGLKTRTVRRNFITLTAIYNCAVRVYELAKGTAFEAINIPNEGKDSKKRQPFTMDELKLLIKDCKEADDDMRWLIAVLINTGARLSEALGLRMIDADLTSSIPHIGLEIHDDRGLKTSNSVRKVPLVGVSMWACERAKSTGPQKREFLFPRYIRKGKIKNNAASAALNNWIKKRVPGKTCHSFRHSMNDRLRAVECPKDIRDAICGWRTPGIGEDYGAGYSLEQLYGWLKKVELS